MKYLIPTLLFMTSLTAFATPKPKTTIEFNSRNVEPQTYLYEMPKMCYRGVAKDVPALLEDMMNSDESVLHRDQGILAIRFDIVQLILDTEGFFATTSLEDIKEEHEANYPGEVSMWVDYDLESKDVLVMSNLGPQGDGTELYATVIQPCKTKPKK